MLDTYTSDNPFELTNACISRKLGGMDGRTEHMQEILDRIVAEERK